MDALESGSCAAATATQAVRVGGVEFQVRAAADRRAYWDRVAAGAWEPQTFQVFRRFLDTETSCIDIGAWIGPTVLYAACLARRVHAFEPDAVAGAELVANIAANPELAPRIEVHACCIAPETGPIDLYAGGMYRGANSRFGDSMSGIVPTGEGTGQAVRRVEGERLADVMARRGVTDCGLIKMDVEGGEYRLIPGLWRDLAARGMPTLYVSFHAPAAAEREALIGACLEELAVCYRGLYAADGAALDGRALLRGVRDWGDEAAGSDWLRLERLLGDGVVASNEGW